MSVEYRLSSGSLLDMSDCLYQVHQLELMSLGLYS